MKWTQTFIPTLREAPSDAESPSHKLMVRAGLIRQLSSGSYSYLPLGTLALRKAEALSDKKPAQRTKREQAIRHANGYLTAGRKLLLEQKRRAAAMQLDAAGT